MPANYGYTFAPGADGNRPQDQAQGGGRPSGLSPQAAVKLLQLRVPERPAAGGIAPQALLQGQGGAGLPGGGGLQAIIQMLMGLSGGGAGPAVAGGGMAPPAGGGGQVPTSGGGGAVPTPRVIPGLDSGVSYRDLTPAPAPSQEIPQDLIDRAQSFDLGGGRTLGGGGGFAGTAFLRNKYAQQDLRDAGAYPPPLF